MEAIDDDHGGAGLGVVGDEAPHRRLGVEVLGLLFWLGHRVAPGVGPLCGGLGGTLRSA